MYQSLLALDYLCARLLILSDEIKALKASEYLVRSLNIVNDNMAKLSPYRTGEYDIVVNQYLDLVSGILAGIVSLSTEPKIEVLVSSVKTRLEVDIGELELIEGEVLDMIEAERDLSSHVILSQCLEVVMRDKELHSEITYLQSNMLRQLNRFAVDCVR